MDAGAVAVVGLVNPVVGTVLGVVLLAEPFGPLHAVAIVVTLVSVLLAQAPVRRRLRPPRGAVRHLEPASAARPDVLAESAVAAPRHTVGACPT
jgi:probable blue pigment (indigoidine) exporter